MRGHLESVQDTHIDELLGLRGDRDVNAEVVRLLLFVFHRLLRGWWLVDLLDVDVEPGKVVLEFARGQVAQPVVKILTRKVNLHLFIWLLLLIVVFGEVWHGRFFAVLLVDRACLALLGVLHDLTHIDWFEVLARGLSEVRLRFLSGLGSRIKRESGFYI